MVRSSRRGTRSRGLERRIRALGRGGNNVAAMQFAGEEVFSQEPEELWRRLTDLSFMARTIPGLESVSRSEPHVLECRVRPGFSFVRGTLDVTMELTEQRPSSAARMQVRAKGIGASLVVETALELTPVETGRPAPGDGTGSAGTKPGTRLRWTAEVRELGGLLKAVSRGLIEAAAKKVIADAWAGFRRELDAAR